MSSLLLELNLGWVRPHAIIRNLSVRISTFTFRRFLKGLGGATWLKPVLLGTILVVLSHRTNASEVCIRLFFYVEGKVLNCHLLSPPLLLRWDDKKRAIRLNCRLWRRKRIDDGALALVIEFMKEQLILLHCQKLLFLLLFLRHFFRQYLRGWNSSFFKQNLWLKPAIGDLKLTLNLLPNEMKLVNGFAEFRTHVLIIFVAKLLGRVFAKVVAKEWVLKSEGVRYLKLLPSYHSASPNLVRLHFEAAVFVAKEVSFLGKNARQDSYDGPA